MSLLVDTSAWSQRELQGTFTSRARSRSTQLIRSGRFSQTAPLDSTTGSRVSSAVPQLRVARNRFAAPTTTRWRIGVKDSHWFVPIYLAANSGMRRGEVPGLTRRNVDLDNARLAVEQLVQSVEYERALPT